MYSTENTSVEKNRPVRPLRVHRSGPSPPRSDGPTHGKPSFRIRAPPAAGQSSAGGHVWRVFARNNTPPRSTEEPGRSGGGGGGGGSVRVRRERWPSAKSKGCHARRGNTERAVGAAAGRRWGGGRNSRFSDLMTCVRSEMCNDTGLLVNIGTSDGGLLCESDVCGRTARGECDRGTAPPPQPPPPQPPQPQPPPIS